ncbi:cell division protein FtsL [Candidatus Desantisbacteria bacterium]|nr:cell division protein FtsL [Candidatus Desantisbacteria bacterium]
MYSEEISSLGQRKGEKMLALLGNPKKSVVTQTVSGYIFSAIVVSFIAFWCIWQHIQVTSMGYEIVELQKQKMKAENTHTILQIECASLKSPQRIEDIAQQMGLKFPEKIEVIYLPQVVNSPEKEANSKWACIWKQVPKHIARGLFAANEAEASEK